MPVSLELVLNSKICYALYYNKMDVLLTASAVNDGDKKENITFKISSQPSFFVDIVCKLDTFSPNALFDLLDKPVFRFDLDPKFISEITESIVSKVTFSVEDEEKNILGMVTQDVNILPFDYWPGMTVPELIPSFITPNTPSLSVIRSKASDILGEWGLSRSLEGYQSEDRDRVLALAASVFAAFERQNINYVNSPAGFENIGQRIRLSDEVLSNHEGTCIDLAVAYAAALESIGLNTVIFFIKGHVFAGLWLVDDFGTDIISWDSSMFTRMIRNKEFRAVECTAFTNTAVTPFEQACQNALLRLEDADNFICAVDVKKSRNSVRPLPVKRDVDGRWTISREEGIQGTTAPESLGAIYNMAENKPLTKVDKWKRELLDITNRNNMINMKQGSKVIPLLVKDTAYLVERLSDESEYTLYPKPQEWNGSAIYNERPFESEIYIGNFEDASSEELDRNRIRTPMTDVEMEKSLRSIYRLASKEIDESGCNCLFISLGVLRWFEGKSSGIPHYAPLILVPVEIKKKQKSFVIKKLEEEAVFNVTLSEKLHQEFEIDIPNMDPLPAIYSWVDVEEVFQTVRHCIGGKDGWDVIQGASLGVFSFSQFAMWKDLDDNIEIFEQNPIVKSFVEGVPYPSEKEMDFNADPYGLCLTVSADGSQIKAVKAASEGKTFVMHGPPGTGKSQTITNMISNALNQNKTVLFVAEKRAALEVVQKRLEEVGIANHCLELHSNKTEKYKVIDQLKNSLTRPNAIDDAKASELMRTINNLREKLDVYVVELHKVREFGLSAYEAISRYELHDVPGAVDFIVDYRSGGSLCESEMVNIEEAIRFADQAFQMVGNVDLKVLDHVGTDKVFASISNDVSEMIRDLRQKASVYQSDLADMKHLNLPVDATDVSSLGSYLERMLSIDTFIINDPNKETIGPELKAIYDRVSYFLKMVDSYADMGVFIRFEDLSNMLNDLTGMEILVEGSVRNHHISDQSPLIRMFRDCKMFCTTILNHSQDLLEILAVWKPGVFEFSKHFDLLSQYMSAEKAGLFSKKKMRNAFMSSVSPYLRNPMSTFDSLKQSIGIISSTAPDLIRVESVLLQYRNNLQIKMEMDSLRNKIRSADKAMAMIKEYGIVPSDLARQLDLAKQANNRLPALRSDFDAWISSSKKFSDYLVLNMDVSEIDVCLSFCDSLTPQLGNLFNWANWNLYANKLKSYGLSSVIPEILKHSDAEILVQSAMRSVYKEFVNVCRQESEVLRMFNSSTFEGFVRQFKNVDQTYMMYNRNLLKYKLAKNVPTNLDDRVPGSETNILYRAVNSSKMRKSIRKLLSEIPHMLPRLCPCLLMSPQSVSQYITMDYPKFDLVIFDESSQITTSKAIGALGRAKNAVIAGDSKQLPPTSFFQRKIEVFDEDDDMTDIDSFLDDCLSLNMPETYLEWHYRSRHESLIAFSNRMFYEGKMLTFPSPNDLETKVSLKHVNGIYERGKRYNSIEAKAVADEVHRRVMDDRYAGQSIGIIAFSISQQTRIQDMLDDMTMRDSRFYERLNAMPEEMFVKNLETVQGDERDVILFSIGYGPDSTGTVYQNFGPINRDGGQRRLNVAVSRARMEMVVFSSMNFNDISISSNSSRGVRSMREFLRFAENRGRFPDSSLDVVDSEGSQILVDIAESLRSNGYDSHFNVGTSMFKVDIGVVNPDKPSDYILGILSDGESYRTSDNTRDREYAREDVLKRLDWNLIHVWSLDWYFNKQKTLKTILDKLDRLRSNPSKEVEDDSQVDSNYGFTDEPMTIVDESVFSDSPLSRRKTYVPAASFTFDFKRDMAISDQGTISHIANVIIKDDYPINEDYLLKLYCRSVRIRLSEQERNYLVSILRKMFRPDMDGPFVTYWTPDSDRRYEYYRIADNPDDNRSIEHIPYIEIANAANDTIAMNGSLQKDIAASAIARNLGFKRTSNKINDTINSVIKEEIKKCNIKETNGRLVL